MRDDPYPTSASGRVLDTGWSLIRAGLLTILTLLHSPVLAVTSAVAFFTFWTAIFFKLVMPTSHFPFWDAMAISGGSLLIYFLYLALIKVVSHD